MRSVWFVLTGATLDEVEQCLARAGFEELAERVGRWNYPKGVDAVLYASCRRYQVEDSGEHADVTRCTAGRTPDVEVLVDVSGRVPGEREVRHVVESLLSEFEGVAFDDYSSLEHGWTLDEIRRNDLVNGRRFFDFANPGAA